MTVTRFEIAMIWLAVIGIAIASTVGFALARCEREQLRADLQETRTELERTKRRLEFLEERNY